MLTSTSAAPGSIFVSCLCAGCTVRPLDLLHRDGGTVLSLDRWIEHVSGVACGAGDLATALDIVAVRQQQATGGAASLVRALVAVCSSIVRALDDDHQF